LPFLSPDVSFFFRNFIFSPPPTQFLKIFLKKISSWNFSHPPAPPNLFIYLLALPPSTYLPGCHSNRPPIVDNDEEKIMKVLHGAWSCSLKQINKGISQVFDTPYIKVLQVLLIKCFPWWGYCKPSG
jgi:hypothetical protein